MRVLEIEAHKMKLLIFFTAMWAVSDVSSSGVTIGITPYSHPVQTQYHSQDVFGQYAYGYSTPTSSKSETKTADGVTQGGYSYIDSNGILQTVQYVSDPIHGFRVAATNLPQDLPDVAYAKAAHLATVEATKAEHAHIAAARVSYTNPIAVPYGAVQQVPLVALPAPVHDLPEVIRARAEHLAAFEATKARDLAAHAEVAAIGAVPAHYSGAVVPVQTAAIATTAPAVSYAHGATHYSYVPAVPAIHQVSASSQYQAQDALGQYSYGYVEPLSSKSETRTADGVVRGGYSYIDANGIVQSVNYISDDINGFRVAATNLPVGPAEIATAHVAAPVAVAAPIAHTQVVSAAPAVAVAPVATGVAVASQGSYYAEAPGAVYAAAPVATATRVAVANQGSYYAETPGAIYAAAPVATATPVAVASQGSYYAEAPGAVYAAAPVATAARVAVANQGSYYAETPGAVYAGAPVAAARVAVAGQGPYYAAAPRALYAEAPATAYAATSHAKLINTVPEAGWYKQEVYY